MINIRRKYLSLTKKNYILIKLVAGILFRICDEPDGYLSDHDTFCIHDDIFDRIQSTNQDKNITWKLISNESNKNE